MVPDFEPELEERIDGAMKDITHHLVRRDEEKKKEERMEQEERRLGRVSFYSTLVALFLVAVISVGFLIYGHMGNAETLLERAGAAAEKKEYAKAAEYTLRAVELDKSNLDARNLLGEYYVLDGQTKNAITAFTDVIAIDRENEEAYRNLIAIYDKKKDYKAIDNLIRSSGSDKIVNIFIKYIANPPTFSYPQGTYEEQISLKLAANTEGDVYYTLDGSEPDEKSQVYTAPIVLDDGIHTVKAFFVNKYGIASETAVQIYEIHYNAAHAPEVSLASGTYSEPQKITVTVPSGESVYYTADGSTPTKDSIQYKNPIALPIGGSAYRFISYNAEGASSEVVSRDYTFLFQATLDLTTAVNLLVVGLMEKGVITDVYCSVPDQGGHNLYVCSSAISINERNYYLMVEYYQDPAGVEMRTGNLYCVDAETGGLYTASIGSDGWYSVVSF